MITPAKSMAVIAIAIAVGGTFAVAIQEPQPAIDVPAAAADPVAPVSFTADWDYSLDDPGDKEVLANGTTRTSNDIWSFELIESSDARFEGTMTLVRNIDERDGSSIWVGVTRIENDGGAWVSLPAYEMERDPRARQTLDRTFIGEGGYDGLIAIVRETWAPNSILLEGMWILPEGADRVDSRLEGYILDANALPPAPDPASPAE